MASGPPRDLVYLQRVGSVEHSQIVVLDAAAEGAAMVGSGERNIGVIAAHRLVVGDGAAHDIHGADTNNNAAAECLGIAAAAADSAIAVDEAAGECRVGPQHNDAPAVGNDPGAARGQVVLHNAIG